MSKKQFLKLLQDPEVQQAIRDILNPDLQAFDITNQVLKKLNDVLITGDKLPIPQS